MSRKIHITTAMPLSKGMHATVEQWVAARYTDCEMVWHIDESLLGGIVIFDGDRVFDGSLRSKLDKLKV